MAEKKAREPVLSLDTFVDRRFITIDGERYELRNPGEFSILDYHRMGVRAGRVDALMAEGELAEEQVQELESLLNDGCRSVLIAPDEIHRKLTDVQRLKVIEAFTHLQRETAAPPAEAEAEAPTGESTSQGS